MGITVYGPPPCGAATHAHAKDVEGEAVKFIVGGDGNRGVKCCSREEVSRQGVAWALLMAPAEKVEQHGK